MTKHHYRNPNHPKTPQNLDKVQRHRGSVSKYELLPLQLQTLVNIKISLYIRLIVKKAPPALGFITTSTLIELFIGSQVYTQQAQWAISVRHLANMFTDSPRPLKAAKLNEFRGLYYLLPIVCCSKSHNKICSNLTRRHVPFGAKWSIKRTLY